MAKQTTRADIKESTVALKAIMQENLSGIAQAMIEQVMNNYAKATPSQQLNATKGVKAKGINFYKEALLNAYAVIAANAIKRARYEVPKASKIRLSEINEDALLLGEFDSLPVEVQKRLKAMLDLLTGTQIADLEKQVFFQFNSSVVSTDSASLIAKDLQEAALDYVDGQAVAAAAGANSAQIINEARLAFFADTDVSEEIEAYEFVNGDPISPICQDLAGTVFAKDDPNLNRYWPPLHFNCKSYIVPILKGNLGNKEIESLEPSTKKIADSVQLSEQIDALLKP